MLIKYELILEEFTDRPVSTVPLMDHVCLCMRHVSVHMCLFTCLHSGMATTTYTIQHCTVTGQARALTHVYLCCLPQLVS